MSFSHLYNICVSIKGLREKTGEYKNEVDVIYY